MGLMFPPGIYDQNGDIDYYQDKYNSDKNDDRDNKDKREIILKLLSVISSKFIVIMKIQ